MAIALVFESREKVDEIAAELGYHGSMYPWGFVDLVVGILLAYGTAAIMPKGMRFLLETKLVFIYSLILLVISLLSSLVSVRTISKTDPLKALGRVE
ncbi:hypothetical protein [Paenibacillus sp. PK3_47]|uniref:hypothetical protein n=1 Tax=Paenibacillus sp. PK3_47 TaxID=2072642 RepID=UPI00201DC3F6|nr:hypothetical protein [Paenibacillus sp. PK3_47]